MFVSQVRSLLRRKFRRRCPGMTVPCCGHRAGLSPRRSSYRYDQTTMSTVMSVSTTDAWQSSPVMKKRPDGGPKMLPLVEESEGDSEKKEAIELDTVDEKNSANTSQEKQSGDLATKDEVEPLLITGLNDHLQNKGSENQQQF